MSTMAHHDTSPKTLQRSPTFEGIFVSVPKQLIHDELKCIICLDVLAKPVCLAPCTHMFCEHCISSWYTAHTNCPTCRSQIVMVTPVPKIIARLLETCENQFPPQVEPEVPDVVVSKRIKLGVILRDCSDSSSNHEDDDNDDDDDSEDGLPHPVIAAPAVIVPPVSAQDIDSFVALTGTTREQARTVISNAFRLGLTLDHAVEYHFSH